MITKRQAFRIVCFVFIVVFCDQLTGKILRQLYFSQKTGQSAGLNYSLYKCKDEILIFGNSRAQRHYDTRIISDSLKMSCYNAGLDGGHSIMLSYVQIKFILKRYTPKILIIEFSPKSITYEKSDYEKLSILLPYYNSTPEIRPLILKKSPWEKTKLLSQIYPFNSLIIDILRFNTKIDDNRKWDINGYFPIKGKHMNSAMVKQARVIANPAVNDPNKIFVLKEIIKLCKNRNVELYFINSPIYRTKQASLSKISEPAKQVMDILKRLEANYIDYSNDTNFVEQMDYYADPIHLNEKGATIYSKLIGQFLRKTDYPKNSFSAILKNDSQHSTNN